MISDTLVEKPGADQLVPNDSCGEKINKIKNVKLSIVYCIRSFHDILNYQIDFSINILTFLSINSNISLVCLSICSSSLMRSCKFSLSRRYLIFSSFKAWKCFSILSFSARRSPWNNPRKNNLLDGKIQMRNNSSK